MRRNSPTPITNPSPTKARTPSSQVQSNPKNNNLRKRNSLKTKLLPNINHGPKRNTSTKNEEKNHPNLPKKHVAPF